MYYSGANLPRHCPRDYDEARTWFRKAAEQGNASGEDHLGMVYYLGVGVPQNYAEAATWFERAAEQGNVHAERQLAEMYATGLGVPRDHDEAEKWSRRVNKAESSSNVGTGFLLVLISLPIVAFAWGMLTLRRRPISGLVSRLFGTAHRSVATRFPGNGRGLQAPWR
jgi:hypothetical protein